MARQDKTEIRQTLARNIRLHMERLDINAAQVARLSGITQGMLSNILSCKSTTRIDTVQKVAIGLGIPYRDLFSVDAPSATAKKDEEFIHLYARWRLVGELDRDIVRRLLSK